MDLKCIRIEDDVCDKLLNENTYDSNTFCTQRWDTFLKNTFNARKNFLGIYNGNEIIGVWPAYTIKKGPLKVLGSPLRGWFTPWLGPRYFDKISTNETRLISKKAMMAFDTYANKERFDYVECASINLDDLTMKRLNYKPLKKATTILDISPDIEKLFKSFSKTCRKRIKKSTKFGCTVENISSINFVPQLWDMTLDVFGRRGCGPAHNPKIIQKLIDAHLKSGKLFCLGVYKDKKLIAIGVHVWNKGYLVDLFRATYIKYYKYYPYYALYWELFNRAKKLGCKYFDMMGVDPNKPDQFKMSFHPKMVTWNHWMKSRTFVAKAGSTIYEFYVDKIIRNMARIGINK